MDLLIYFLVIAMSGLMLFIGITLFMSYHNYLRWVHLLTGFGVLLIGLGVLLYLPLLVIGSMLLVLVQVVHTLLSWLIPKVDHEFSLLSDPISFPRLS